VNGREKDTRSFGKLPIIWTCNLFLWITQTLQELTTANYSLGLVQAYDQAKELLIDPPIPICYRKSCRKIHWSSAFYF